MIFKAINKHKRAVRIFAAFIALNLFVELAMPLRALALTGGPSQPEVQSFEPVSANQMVDPFSGDFTYNIPLLDVGGYPINISYHAAPGIDEEASWVGLGWNINPGVINRNMRGIPDDFNGDDKIKKTLHMKNNVEVELKYKRDIEIFGKKGGLRLGYGLGIKYNNYKGFGYNLLVDVSYKNKKGKGPMGLGVGLDFDSQDGVDLDMSLSYKKNAQEICEKSMTTGSVSLGINSRMGLKALSLSSSHQTSHKEWKKKGKIKSIERRGGNGGASLTFNNPSYSPSAPANYNTFGFSLGFEFGKNLQGVDPKNDIDLSFSFNGIKNNGDEVEYPAYGYLYNNKAWETIKDKKKGLMDFNREREMALNKFTKYLPLAYNTYDVLGVSGQGISGTYRPFYSSVGMVADPYSKSFFNPNVGLGFEFGNPLPAPKIGIDINASFSFSAAGGWDKDNDAYQHVNFATTASNIDFEPSYYKNIGEKVKNDMTFYNKFGAYDAIEIELDPKFAETKVKDNAKDEGGNNYSLTTGWQRQKREARNQVISHLTFDEAASYGLIYNSEQSLSSYYNPSVHKGHHIAEYTVTNPDGSRYVYGVPAYNIKQKEATFNISANKSDSHSACDGVVDYNGGSHEIAGPGNTGGVDNYYSAEETPPYAHSYLLSAVLSADYIDVTGNGPSEDDFGNYTFIKYNRAHSDYKWRTPYTNSTNKGNLQKGYPSDNLDDRANYIYGEKEIWYIEKIQTKTHIAIFFTSNRKDGLEAFGEHGGKNTATGKVPKKLDKIELYTLEDYQLNGPNAVPIKTVFFTYDYSLCKNIKNFKPAYGGDPAGKLTLKNISFSYRKSTLATLSPYTFNYNEGSLIDNPNYMEKSYDRWGNYKPNNCSSPEIDEYPYTLQDNRTTKSDIYAAAWSLREVILPSGGKIKVDYEADDYAYVQDKKAMEMVTILGASTSPSGNYNNHLYYKKDNYLYLFFNYRDNLTNSYTADSINKYYWNGDKYIYYSFNIDLESSNYEQVNGYAEVDGFGIKDPINKIAWVKIKDVDRNDRTNGGARINPISKMAWQYARTNLPHLVYPGSDLNRSAKLADLLFFGPELYKMVRGYEATCHDFKRGMLFNTSKSWVRLISPESKKIGGGYRVKQIRLIDNWSQMNYSSPNEQDATIGQIYEYQKYDEETKRMISSGVASYEPLVGGDENPFRYPNNGLELQRSNFFAPLNIIPHDIPVGESVYASASVGYSRVVIRNIKPKDLGIPNETITRHGTGYTVHEFWTAKEFPIKVSQTSLQVDIKRKPLLKLIGFSFERASGTQGFSIELNDMHGKMKAQFEYDEFDNRQSGVEYFFRIEDAKAATYRLNNKATILKKDGTVEENATLGVEMEMLVDPQQRHEKNHAGAFSNNMNGISLGIIPFLPILTFFVNYSYHGTKVRTITTTKIINRYALIDSVVAYDQDAQITTRNLAWDGETGEVLLTKTENEYDDNIYNLSYPAHWAYDGMGHAYKNIGLTYALNAANGNQVSSGSSIVNNTLGKLLFPGDEMIVQGFTPVGLPAYTPTRLWVLDKKKNVDNSFTVTYISRYGVPAPSGDYTLKIIRSGRRNMQSSAVGVTVSKDNPLDMSAHLFARKTDFDSVINTSAVKFSDRWQTYSYEPGCWQAGCEPFTVAFAQSCFNGMDQIIAYSVRTAFNSLQPGKLIFPSEGQVANPYIWGIRGDWRAEQSYVYFDRSNTDYARTQTTSIVNDLNTTYTRNNGLITNYEPFWRPNSGDDWVDIENVGGITNNPWVWNTKITQANPDGAEVENKDALDIYSSAQYSYMNKLPVAIANNSKLNQMVFENFEDYGNDLYSYLACNLEPQTAYISSAIYGSLIMRKVATSPMHWYLWPGLKYSHSNKFAYVTGLVSHTGFRSLKIFGDTLHIPVYTDPGTTNYNTAIPLSDYKVEKQDFVSVFAPITDAGKNEYILSYWQKATLNPGTINIYVPATLSNIPLTQIGIDNKVEGWVRKEFKLILPNTVSFFEVKILNNGIGNNITSCSYFDDIRIFPLKGNMKGFVYDNTNQRLMAELDENNYATLFEYDDEGNLVRTKKETERGIITLNENRENIKK